MAKKISPKNKTLNHKSSPVVIKDTQIKTKIFLSILSIIVSLVLVEIFLQLFYFSAQKKLFGLTPQESTLNYYDNDLLGHALIPNQQGWFVSPTKEYYSQVTVNSDGWPDDEHVPTKEDSTYRIIILGDSFVENFQVSLNQRFFKTLEKKLNTISKQKVEIIALGRGNIGTAVQYLILQNYAAKYEPDLVVHLFFTANDIKNNSPILQNDPYLPYFTLDPQNNLKLLPAAKRSQRKLAPLKENLKKLKLTKIFLSLRQVYLNNHLINLNGYPQDYDIYQLDYNTQYQKAWEITQRLILASQNEAQNMNAKYLLVALANNEQVNPEVWDSILTLYPQMNPKDFDLEKPDQILKDYCSQRDLTCFFMLPYFREYINNHPNSATHFRIDGHFNQTGTNLASDFLFYKLSPFL